MSEPTNAPNPRAPGQGVVIRPRERGRLEVTDRVVMRIAGQVAGEVSGISREPGGLRGLTRRFDGGRPAVRVHLTPEYVDLAIEVAVAYPRPIRGTCDEIRRQVIEKVERLAGVPVRRVDIDVTGLVYEPTPAPVALPRPQLGPGRTEPHREEDPT